MTDINTTKQPIKGTNEQTKIDMITEIPTKIYRGDGFITISIYSQHTSLF